MSSFNARLRLPGRSRLPLGVEVDIFHEQMTLTAGERTVATWPLGELEVASLPDGFHIKVDGEELVLNVADSTRFAAELGVDQRHPSPPVTKPAVTHRDQFADVRRRIEEVAEALTSEAVSPAEAFARWLGLLKEVNRRHGQGSMPSDVYYRLNTELLDLIPLPSPVPA